MHLGMGMQNPIPTYTYLVTQLGELFPDLAYLHVVEPRTLPDGQPREVKPGQVWVIANLSPSSLMLKSFFKKKSSPMISLEPSGSPKRSSVLVAIPKS